MAMLSAAARLTAIAAVAGLLGCNKPSTGDGGPTAKQLIGGCTASTPCGRRAGRGVLIILEDPASGAATLKSFVPDSEGDGAPDGGWTNVTSPPGKKTQLDVDLNNIAGLHGKDDNKHFAFVVIEVPGKDYYFRESDAIESSDTKRDMIRAVRVSPDNHRLKFKVRLDENDRGSWINYDLFVMKKVGGKDQRLKVDPKVKNGGYEIDPASYQ